MERRDKNERVVTVDECDMRIAVHSFACQDEEEEEVQFGLGQDYQLIPVGCCSSL